MILMKHKSIFTFVLMISLFLVACSNSINVHVYEVQNREAETSIGDFQFRLVSEKEIYQDDEDLNLYGEITYVGDKEDIEIVHSSSPVFFNISEATRQLNIEDSVQDIGVTTTLKRDEPYRISYDKSNSFVADDQDFYHDFMELDGFPVGYYTVNGLTDFSVFEHGDDQAATPYNIEATVDFKVAE